MSTPEGATFEYTDAVVDKMTKFIQDSISEKRVCLTVTAPNFAGTGSPNSAFGDWHCMNRTSVNGVKKKSLNIYYKNHLCFLRPRFWLSNNKLFYRRFWWFAGTICFTSSPILKTKRKLPVFLEEASKNKTFKVVDANLKFNKPELNVSVDRERARDLGVSVQDIAQTLQLAFSPQRLSLF